MHFILSESWKIEDISMENVDIDAEGNYRNCQGRLIDYSVSLKKKKIEWSNRNDIPSTALSYLELTLNP